ncbi:hypothetical protein BDP27DRAFT_1422950 [Rhodocollybia butyracea]|uniref:Uncharacterized protein n=1 Tax=Rhodocollybia butyracea TaxID=206335 RepID=A0A9P5PQ22_9AGAR|nr:hypothetical protein BDP27DRAFT_1422950 [Rhodocollybia butyracea]
MGSGKTASTRKAASQRGSVMRKSAKNGNKDEVEEKTSPVSTPSSKPYPKPKSLAKPSAPPNGPAPDDNEAAQLLMSLGQAPKRLTNEEYERQKAKNLDSWVSSELERFTNARVQYLYSEPEKNTPVQHRRPDFRYRRWKRAHYTSLKRTMLLSSSPLALQQLTSHSCFAVANNFEVPVTYLGSIGYTASYQPKTPKPVPKLVNNEDRYERMLESVDDHIQESKSKKKGKGVVKPFTVRIVNTSSPGDGKKDGKKDVSSGKKSLYSQGKKANEDEPALTVDVDEQEHILHQKIEKNFHCDEHNKPCWTKTSDGSHYHFTTGDLSIWASLAWRHCATLDVPPQKILQSIDNHAGFQSHVRGRARATDNQQWQASPSPYGPYTPPPPFWGFPPADSTFASIVPSHQSLETISHASCIRLASVVGDEQKERGNDSVNYARFDGVLRDEGILRIDDLLDLRTADHLQRMLGCNWGTANRIMRYAKEDIGSTRSHKKARHSK